MNAKTLAVLAVTSGFFPIASALAHHAFSAQFDADRTLTITGKVTRLEWQNPHTWFYLDVEDGNGNVVSWAFELASPNLLMRNGWKRDSMRIGDVVTVEGFHAKDGSNTANARTVVLTASGRTLLTGRSTGGRQ